MVAVNRNKRPWRLTVRPSPDDRRPPPRGYTTTHLDRLLQEAYGQLTDPWPDEVPFAAVAISHRNQQGEAVLSIIAGRLSVSGWGDVDHQVRRLLSAGVSAGYRGGIIPGDLRAERAGLIPYGDRVTWKLQITAVGQTGLPVWYGDARAAMRDAGGYVRRNPELVATVSRADPAAGQVHLRYADGHYSFHGTGPVVEELNLERAGQDDTLRVRHTPNPARTTTSPDPSRDIGHATACRTGRHTWLDPANAAKCCNPLWTRNLVVYAPDERVQPGDHPIPDLPGTAWRWTLATHPTSRSDDPVLHHHVIQPSDDIPLD
jgi:hypothetical protein